MNAFCSADFPLIPLMVVPKMETAIMESLEPYLQDEQVCINPINLINILFYGFVTLKYHKTISFTFALQEVRFLPGEKLCNQMVGSAHSKTR